MWTTEYGSTYFKFSFLHHLITHWIQGNGIKINDEKNRSTSKKNLYQKICTLHCIGNETIHGSIQLKNHYSPRRHGLKEKVNSELQFGFVTGVALYWIHCNAMTVYITIACNVFFFFNFFSFLIFVYIRYSFLCFSFLCFSSKQLEGMQQIIAGRGAYQVLRRGYYKCCVFVGYRWVFFNLF